MNFKLILLLLLLPVHLLSDIILINFDSGLKNTFGGYCGAFDYNPKDFSSFCKISLEKDNDLHFEGKYLQIDYDVLSPLPAFNGVWFKLNHANLSDYDALFFNIKGDIDRGFTRKFKIELKSGNSTIYYIITGITDKWKKVKIPFKKFKLTGGNFNWKKVDELVFVFEDFRVTEKEGRIYIDDIGFSGGKQEIDINKKQKQLNSLVGFPSIITKHINIKQSNKKFLYNIAKDTWLYFANIIDKKTYLVLDNIKVAKNIKDIVIGDYTNITNIGLQIMAIISAYDFGFITEKEALKMLKKLLTTIKKLKKWNGLFYNYYKTDTGEIANKYISTVDNGWLACGLICLRNSFYGRFKKEADKILKKMNFGLLYDNKLGQLYLGYDTEKKEYSPYHYGLIVSESRIASIIGIGKGDLPKEHWFKIYRVLPPEWDWQRQIPRGRWKKYLGVKVFQGYYTYKGVKFVPSWGGSMFEFFMPNMVIDELKWGKSNFGLNNKRILKLHIQYSKEKGYKLWGFSPCSTPDESFGGYHEFGVPFLGAKGYEDGGVITPHAIVLPILYNPEECIKTLKKLLKLYPDMYGEYGFYDSVNIKKNITGRKYLALDQAMILITLNNYLNNRAMQKRFEKDTVFRNFKYLMEIEKFF